MPRAKKGEQKAQLLIKTIQCFALLFFVWYTIKKNSAQKNSCVFTLDKFCFFIYIYILHNIYVYAKCIEKQKHA